MTFDVLAMTAVAAELREMAIGARVQRVTQPSRQVIVLSLYHAGEEYGLLLSTHPHHARVHLTGRSYRLPQQPPPFCMLLRKYLTGARISAVVQPHLERILMLHFEAHEVLPPVKIIAEIMGRRSNVILVDEEEIILGAIKTATREQNPRRAVLPGLPYEEVPPQSRLDPSETEGERLAATLLPLLAKGSSPDQALLKTVRAISPLAARELIYRSKWDKEAPLGSLERLTREMKALFGKSGALEACMAPQLNIYASYPLTHLQDSTLQKFTKMSELLDHYYSRLEEAEERKLLQDRLRSRVNRRKRSLEMKLEQLKRDLLQAGEADRYRIYGETLLTYGTGINSRAEEIILPSLYQPDEKITIPMNPSLDALGNAQKYFRIYRKISNSRKHLKKHISRLQGELAYCRELLYTIEEGSAASLLEIREELVESGYMKPDSRKKPQRKKKRRREKPQPLSFLASSGKKILVGQNNRQNDHLTFKLATRYDIWLHAQRLPGSHVIIKGAGTGPPAESDLQEAALLAAHYSRGRDLPAVAVDYTEVRHVKRAPGGRPGFVLYEPFKTIIVNPQEEELRHLLEQRSSTPPKNPEYG